VAQGSGVTPEGGGGLKALNRPVPATQHSPALKGVGPRTAITLLRRPPQPRWHSTRPSTAQRCPQKQKARNRRVGERYRRALLAEILIDIPLRPKPAAGDVGGPWMGRLGPAF